MNLIEIGYRMKGYRMKGLDSRTNHLSSSQYICEEHCKSVKVHADHFHVPVTFGMSTARQWLAVLRPSLSPLPSCGTLSSGAWSVLPSASLSPTAPRPPGSTTASTTRCWTCWSAVRPKTRWLGSMSGLSR